ncbi:MAG: tetratricopeptide repeat-containing sensor histidine kinase [Nonlabens sp.]|uniref:tetratricopeptide repeat-containing sensor histidine kinase n=1 Tax=Nonlabens sp. TaxID=1888209 RepID=UPI003EF4BF00
MRLSLFILIFFASIQWSHSQEKEIDSLETFFSSIENDSLLFVNFNKSATQYRKKDSKVHFYIINKGLMHATKVKSARQEAIFTRELGIYYRKKGALDSAIISYNNAIDKFASTNDSISVFISKSSLANVYKAKADYPKAIQTFKETISFFESQGKKGKMQALVTTFNLGGVYQEMLEWESADRQFEAIYNDSLAQSNKALIRSVCINLSATKQRVNQLDKALEYAEIAEKIETRPRSLANLYINIGSIYEKKENYQKANDYYLKSLNIFTELNSNNGIQVAYNNLGNNATMWKKYALAENYLLKSKTLLENGDNLKSLQHNYSMLSTLYENKGEFESSLEYQKKYMVLRDSVLGIEKQNAIADYEVKYETEKAISEKELAQRETDIARLESQKNRDLFIGALVIVGLLLLVSLVYYSRLKAKKKAELIAIELKETQKRLAIEKQYRDSELKALKAQMNPHFIFNALNSIQDYIVLNQKNLASDYLGKFADLIRNYLHFSDTGFISIPDEVYNLNLYLELEKLRFEEQLDYSFHVSENANSDAINIPTMLIQPYVENALKHGLLHKKDKRKLSITISKVSDKIVECTVEDNGIGRAKSKEINAKRETQHKSFALKATTERLDLLNYGKEKKIGVEIIDLNDNGNAIGTKVILKIPIQKQ